MVVVVAGACVVVVAAGVVVVVVAPGEVVVVVVGACVVVVVAAAHGSGEQVPGPLSMPPLFWHARRVFTWHIDMPLPTV